MFQTNCAQCYDPEVEYTNLHNRKNMKTKLKGESHRSSASQKLAVVL